jgi:hypothetical protein
MMAEICASITDTLNKSGLDTRQIAVMDLISGKMNLTRPAVNVTISEGDFQKVTIARNKPRYKCTCDVSLLIVFQSLKTGLEGEAIKREGIWKILEAIVVALQGQDMGLALENPLFPKSLKNVTTKEYAQAGFLLYNLMMWCSFLIEPVDNDDRGILGSLLAKYYLQPRTYTGMIGVTGPEASDLIFP